RQATQDLRVIRPGNAHANLCHLPAVPFEVLHVLTPARGANRAPGHEERVLLLLQSDARARGPAEDRAGAAPADLNPRHAAHSARAPANTEDRPAQPRAIATIHLH